MDRPMYTKGKYLRASRGRDQIDVRGQIGINRQVKAEARSQIRKQILGKCSENCTWAGGMGGGSTHRIFFDLVRKLESNAIYSDAHRVGLQIQVDVTYVTSIQIVFFLKRLLESCATTNNACRSDSFPVESKQVETAPIQTV